MNAHVVFLTSAEAREFVIYREHIMDRSHAPRGSVAVPVMTAELAARSRASDCAEGVTPTVRGYLTQLFVDPEGAETDAAFERLSPEERLLLRALLQCILEANASV